MFSEGQFWRMGGLIDPRSPALLFELFADRDKEHNYGVRRCRMVLMRYLLLCSINLAMSL